MIARVFDDDNSMYYCTLCSRPMKELNQANEHEKYCGKAVPVQPTFEKDDATQFYTNEARTWQGLTDAEIHRTTVLMGFNPEWKTEIGMVHAIVRNLEAALKKKNT